jgi:hypothetical protein
MVKITINRTTTKWQPDLSSYSLRVDVASTENIVREVFVMQRLKSFVSDQFEDVFAAVATPAQLEDLPANAPGKDTSYFRKSSVELVVRTLEGMNAVFDSLVYELNKLCLDIDVLQNDLKDTKQYIISSGAPVRTVNTVISSGRIGDITPLQEISIVAGVIVETSDGSQWVYTGQGSKTSETSYIKLNNVSQVEAGGTNISIEDLYICDVPNNVSQVETGLTNLSVEDLYVFDASKQQ